MDRLTGLGKVGVMGLCVFGNEPSVPVKVEN
jgi:hypothetical protein